MRHFIAVKTKILQLLLICYKIRDIFTSYISLSSIKIIKIAMNALDNPCTNIIGMHAGLYFWSPLCWLLPNRTTSLISLGYHSVQSNKTHNRCVILLVGD